jgi:hypothetical protein
LKPDGHPGIGRVKTWVLGAGIEMVWAAQARNPPEKQPKRDHDLMGD